MSFPSQFEDISIEKVLCHQKHVNHISQPNRIVLYGFGELGRLALHYCQKVGIEVECIVDQACTIDVPFALAGYKCFNPYDKSLEPLFDIPIAICIASSSYQSIKIFLQDAGWKNVFPFYQLAQTARDEFPLTNGWLIGDITNDELKQVRLILQSLHDRCSRAHYQQFLAWHSSYTELCDDEFPIKTNERYSIKPVLDKFKNQAQRIVDIGAHYGQLLTIMESVHCTVSEYVAFEPDSYTREKLLLKLRNRRLNTIDYTVYPYCVSSSCQSSVSFYTGLDYCSKISKSGNTSLPMVTVDSMCLSPSIIKIHTEGSELECIKGSMKTIAMHRPILMVSLYHNRDGFCRLLAYCMTSLKEYKYYFRLHSYQGTGAFLYAIPT